MLVAQVRRTIETRGLIPQQAKVLCACSGGPDSAAMLAALERLGPQLGFELEVASVDHGLRPDARGDVELAGRQAAQLGLPFTALQVEVRRDSGSIQGAARAARYGALLALAAERGCSRVAVGHTRDDQAETVLMRVLRGAGLRGLGGIRPLRDDGVIRPLIDCGRALVHGFAHQNFGVLAEDSSNSDPRFERVRVRQQLLPALSAEAPRLVEHLASLADEARSWTEAREPASIALLQAASKRPEEIAIPQLLQAPRAVARRTLALWLECAHQCVPSRDHLRQLMQASEQGRGEGRLGGARVVRVCDRGTRLRAFRDVSEGGPP